MQSFLTLKSKLLFLAVIIPLFVINARQPKKLTKAETDWFNKMEWKQGIAANPDLEVDIASFVSHYKKHPERWKIVFDFIKNHDLATMNSGKQDLGDGVTVSVQDYISKSPDGEILEGHRKNIDFQYVVSGKELEGYAKISDTISTIDPYSETKDVAHYKVHTITYHVAQPDRFAIYFPDDLHITNIQYGDKAPFRKVVFKVKVD